VKDLTGISQERAMRLAELPIREAIVQSGEFGPAFQIETPQIVIPGVPSLEKVRARMEPVIRGIFPDEAETRPGEQEEKESEAEKKPSLPTWLTSKVRRVLESIAANPHYSVEERTEETGLGLSAENNVRTTLMDYGLVDCGGQFANRRKLYVLTAKGREWCKELGIRVVRYKSGIEHEACLQAVTRSLLRSSSRITSCKGFSVEGVQPDSVKGHCRPVSHESWKEIARNDGFRSGGRYHLVVVDDERTAKACRRESLPLEEVLGLVGRLPLPVAAPVWGQLWRALYEKNVRPKAGECVPHVEA